MDFNKTLEETFSNLFQKKVFLSQKKSFVDVSLLKT